jgi:Helix-turn-helix domain
MEVSTSPTYWALEQQGLSPTQKLLLLVLAVRANNKTWRCFPGIETLESDTGFKRKAIIDATEVLQEKKLITKKRRGRTSNMYTLLGPTLEVPREGTTGENSDVPSEDSDVPSEDARSPLRDTLTISNSKGYNSSKDSVNQKTRDRSLRDDLEDTSWAKMNIQR